MESADFIRVPTIIQRAASAGVTSALLTCKVKTIHLLGRGAKIAVAAEAPPPEVGGALRSAGDHIQSRDKLLAVGSCHRHSQHRPDIGLLYVHTTDYPMHTWAPEARESKEHSAELDRLLVKPWMPPRMQHF